MSTPITPQQLASILQKSAMYRTDIKRAAIKPAEDDPSMLLVDVIFYTEGRRKQIEALASKCLDGRTCGQIIEQWCGPAPKINPVEARRLQPALLQQQQTYLNNTPSQVLALIVAHKKNPPPPPPRSKFDWNAPRPTPENPSGVIPSGPPDPVSAGKPETSILNQIDEKTVEFGGELFRHIIPEKSFVPTASEIIVQGHTYTRCLTKDQMIAMGYDASQRAEQYRKQRGKHPDDEARPQNG